MSIEFNNLHCVSYLDVIPKQLDNGETMAILHFGCGLKVKIQSMYFSNGYWDATVRTVEQDAISTMKLQDMPILSVVGSNTLLEEGSRLAERLTSLDHWHFFVTENLRSISKQMIYLVIPVWDNTDSYSDKLTQIMTSILSYCNTHSIESVAFPIIGRISKKIPIPVSSQSLLRAISDFSSQKQSLNLQLIEIILTDHSSIDSFTSHFLTPVKQYIHAHSDISKAMSPVSIGREEEKCLICLDDLHSAVKPIRKLQLCKHEFHEQCLHQALEVNPRCPLCRERLAIQRGNQPPGGQMTLSRLSTSLPGYGTCGTIEIHYFIPGGVQDASHPNPGKPYFSTVRTAYLPDNTKGKRVHSLLQVAFERGLTFTVGRSLTLGYDNMITWNDIHHKTMQHGFEFGYPDLDYMDRVLAELKDKGVE